MHLLSKYDQLIILTIFFIVIIVILIFFRKRAKKPSPPSPSPPSTKYKVGYKRIENIFTASERKFFAHLKKAVGKEFYIFAKVRVADVMLPQDTEKKGHWRGAFNRVACKHFDYVLCDMALNIVAAIELDDPSHERADRVERDRFIEWACKSAGVPLVRIKTAQSYDVKALRRAILHQIGK